MAAVLTHQQGDHEEMILEDGVAWTFGASGADFPFEYAANPFHRMVVSSTSSGRWTMKDELHVIGYCCDHCNGPIDETPATFLNQVLTQNGRLRTGDVLGFMDNQWRVDLRVGPVGPARDLLRVPPPPTPHTFEELLREFDASLDALSGGGLLRFVHHPRRQADLRASFLRAHGRAHEAPAPARTVIAAGLVALARVGALQDEQLDRALGPYAREEEGLDPWIRLSALSVLARDEDAGLRWMPMLRSMVAAALVEGDDPAAAASAAETLALIADDAAIAPLSHAARAAAADAPARRRRSLAVAILGSLSSRDPECARAVLRAASDPHELVRLAATRALPRLPDAHGDSATRALLGLLGDADEAVFEAAYAALFEGATQRLSAEALLEAIDRAANEAPRLARLTQALDRLTA